MSSSQKLQKDSRENVSVSGTDRGHLVGRDNDVLAICHEVNSVRTPLTRQGAIEFAIATKLALLLREALAQLEFKPAETARDAVLLDFEVYTRFNLPDFAER